jgi:hypothetical protein
MIILHFVDCTLSARKCRLEDGAGVLYAYVRRTDKRNFCWDSYELYWR